MCNILKQTDWFFIHELNDMICLTFDRERISEKDKFFECLLRTTHLYRISQLINMNRASLCDTRRNSGRSFFNQRQRDAVQRTADGALEPGRFTTP